MENNKELSRIKNELIQRKNHLNNKFSLIHLASNLDGFSSEELEAREVIVNYITELTPLLNDKSDLISLGDQIQVDYLISLKKNETFQAIELIEHFIKIILLYEAKNNIFSPG